MFYVPTPMPGNSMADSRIGTDSVSSPNDYETDWLRLNENEIRFIRTYSLAGNLRLSKIRSVYWRMLLGMFPDTNSEWLASLRSMRMEYDDVKTHFTLDPRTSSCTPDDNPLSLDRNSVWNKYFCDQELKRFIRQDVTRTSADRRLFQLPDMHDRLVDILFFYARRNPEICYRQGMHELLAPIVSILHTECDSFAKENSNTVINATLSELLNPDYLDHDAFSLFSCLMKHMRKFYEIEGLPNSCGYFPPQNNFNESICSSDSIFENAIVTHLNELQDELKKNDPQLHDHLKTLDINYSVFGIRWLRLLFGREFLFESLLVLWDAIFAIDSDFVLVKYVSLALLMIQRRELLISDEVQCLKHLMKCPNSLDVMLVINYALYLKDPRMYKEPNLPIIRQDNYSPIDSEFRRIPSMPSRIIPMNSAPWTKVFKNKKENDLKISSGSEVFGVVDDCSPKSFAMLVSELKHMRLVMSLCKIKLMQYHEVLAKAISADDVDAVHALEGIKEICQFLDVDHFSLKSTATTATSAAPPSQVEPALEAEEVVAEPTVTMTKSYSNPTLDVVASFLPPPNTDLDMILFNYSENELADPSKFPRKHPIRHNPQFH